MLSLSDAQELAQYSKLDDAETRVDLVGRDWKISWLRDGAVFGFATFYTEGDLVIWTDYRIVPGMQNAGNFANFHGNTTKWFSEHGFTRLAVATPVSRLFEWVLRRCGHVDDPTGECVLVALVDEVNAYYAWVAAGCPAEYEPLSSKLAGPCPERYRMPETVGGFVAVPGCGHVD